MNRDTFGAIVTSRANSELKEIMIVRAGNENQARALIRQCAEKLGWQSDGHIYQVFDCPQPEIGRSNEPTILTTPIANQVKDSLRKPSEKP